MKCFTFESNGKICVLCFHICDILVITSNQDCETVDSIMKNLCSSFVTKCLCLLIKYLNRTSLKLYEKVLMTYLMLMTSCISIAPNLICRSFMVDDEMFVGIEVNTKDFIGNCSFGLVKCSHLLLPPEKKVHLSSLLL